MEFTYKFEDEDERVVDYDYSPSHEEIVDVLSYIILDKFYTKEEQDLLKKGGVLDIVLRGIYNMLYEYELDDFLCDEYHKELKEAFEEDAYNDYRSYRD